MNLLLKHHLIAGWRNILKYKVQNIISVLCLAVGTVMFAVVFWIFWSNWSMYYYENIASPSHLVSMKDKNNPNELLDDKKEEKVLVQLQSLNTVEALTYKTINNKLINIYSRKGNKEFVRSTSYRIVSPDWFETYHLRSAITGKRFGKLKNGTVIIPDRLQKKYQQDSTMMEVIGAKVVDAKKKLIVSDVVNTDWLCSFSNNLLVVSDLKQNFMPENNELFYYIDVYVTLKKGVTQAQFLKEAEQKISDCKIDLYDRPATEILEKFIGLVLVLLLGACALVVGLTGYLKMQIQLFYLRNREMALRRCNGAKHYQQFLLLSSEMFITFMFVLLLTIAISIALYNYAIPKIQLVIYDFYLPKTLIFKIEGWIVGVTFLLSTLIAWISSRKVMQMPLSETVGKNNVIKTRWRSGLQVMQYYVASVILGCVVLAYAGITVQISKYNIKGDINQYKNVIEVFPEVSDFIDNIPSMEHIARIVHIRNAVMLDAVSMKRMGCEFVDAKHLPLVNESGDTIFTLPLLAKRNEAHVVCKQLGLRYNSSKLNGARIVSPLKDYVQIGYTTHPDIFKVYNNGTNYYAVRPHLNAEMCKEISQQYDTLQAVWWDAMAFPKEGMEKQMKCDIDRFAHIKLHNENYYFSFFSAYDNYCRELIRLNLIGQLCFLLFIVCIISIVLTVFSSVALETRGRQKEVAIRKINGAKTKDIILLFSRPYIKALGVTYLIALFTVLVVIFVLGLRIDIPSEAWLGFALLYFISNIIITLVTFLTIWQKIYKVAKTNPAEIIQNS
ncbi:MAG: FtsX-like permease family protein [Prevotella sp.]|nr:FtsX-like permease family protein [Prevotella sp.]